MSATDNKRLVLFDLDGTLTSRDSMFDFILHAVGWKIFLAGILANFINMAGVKLGLVAAQAGKEKLLGWYFGGWSKEQFASAAGKYSLERLDAIVRADARQCFQSHIDSGDTVCVVTASVQDWVAPWCELHGVGCIASQMEVSDGDISGKFLGKNNNGPEKVTRVRQKFNVDSFAKVIAFGDSRGDLPLLDFADESHYKKFVAR